MRCFFTLAILLTFLCITKGATAAPARPGLLAPAVFAVGDSTPVQKEAGLLKRIIAFLHFKKNFIAAQQKRVLAIIDSTGLQKAVDSIQSQVTAQGKAATAQETQIVGLINDLAKSLDSLKKPLPVPAPSPGKPLPGDTVDMPGGAGSFQDLVSQVVPMLQGGPSDAAAQKASAVHVAMIQRLLARPPLEEDTIKINDTLSKSIRIGTVHTREVRGFYPYWSRPGFPRQTYEVINNVDYYGATFQPSTGNLDMHGWDTAAVIQNAKAAGANLSLTLFCQRPGAVDTLLRSRSAQFNLILHLRSLLSYHNAEGVTIFFEKLPAGAVNSERFTQFMDDLSDSLHASPFLFKVNLVLPRVDPARQFNLEALGQDVDRFLVDFTHVEGDRRGPLAPLQGMVNNDVQSCMSRYLATGLPPSHFFLVLPYYGIIDTPGTPRYITYGRIRSLYAAEPRYDDATGTAFLDTPGRARIWFDDARTLSKKYDYVLSAGLGGVAIRLMGDDAPYGELQEALMDKFVVADTTYIADIRKVSRPLIPFTGWKWTLPYLQAKYEQYEFLFSYPCVIDFPKVLRKRWSRMGIDDLDRNSVEDECRRSFGILTLFFFLVFGGLLLLFAYQIRRKPRWVFRKPCMAIMVLVAVLVTVSAFMWAFVTRSIGGFGTSSEPQECYDFPLSTLFWFIVVGLLIGGVITRYLVFPLIKKDHIP
ncbi:glycosyl hydrolase family 18 protein [Dinghuibacter silviterrae]|uniref:Glycosyl hydrolase family 18 (Putative chitinase) n=1 Tax=Dinghuibacter silviterrae TaxID=1539049 RepID=A0A4R8DV47_9BACT|nr:glycosyl hydrolase family 18 protein [Dinghuibacter silviterrae]TDX01287.1 glycosyl hydrolase family 18 (putative chitinase) [Dinghuibacter silviterrae]